MDGSGRVIQSNKRGAIDSDLEPILLRVEANPKERTETICRFDEKFGLVAGLINSLRDYADPLGKWWFKGVAAAQAAFISPPMQMH